MSVAAGAGVGSGANADVERPVGEADLCARAAVCAGALL